MTSVLGAFGSDWDEALLLSKTGIALSNANLDSRAINVDVQKWVPGPHGFQSCWAGSRREDIERNSPSVGAHDTNRHLLHDTCWEQSACRRPCRLSSEHQRSA